MFIFFIICYIRVDINNFCFCFCFVFLFFYLFHFSVENDDAISSCYSCFSRRLLVDYSHIKNGGLCLIITFNVFINESISETFQFTNCQTDKYILIYFLCSHHLFSLVDSGKMVDCTTFNISIQFIQFEFATQELYIYSHMRNCHYKFIATLYANHFVGNDFLTNRNIDSENSLCTILKCLFVHTWLFTQLLFAVPLNQTK